MRSSLLLLLSALAACSVPPTTAAGEAVTPPALGRDDLPCTKGTMVWARRLELVESLDRRPIDSFARLRPAERHRLDLLQGQPDVRLGLLQHGTRLAVTFPQNHPIGAAEVLIVDELDEAAIHFADRNQRMTVPRERLADLYDASTRTSARAGFELDLAPVPTEELRPDERPAAGLKQHTVSAQVRFRYFPNPERAGSWTLSLAARLQLRDEIVPPAGEAPGPTLLAALPLLGGGDGLTLLSTITAQVGRTLRFSVQIANESKPAAVAPTREYRVIDHGWVRTPLTSFCFQRPGYRELRAPRARRPGAQLISPAALAGLRGSRAGGPLQVHNRSACAALVYLDGALLGFVSAGEQMSFRGIPEGYYRIFARSPTGIRAFGPFDAYVPGPLTLR